MSKYFQSRHLILIPTFTFTEQKSPEQLKFILSLTFSFDKDTQMLKSFVSLVIDIFQV